MEAISKAGAAIGILAKDGVVLAAEKKITSKVKSATIECMRFSFTNEVKAVRPSTGAVLYLS